MAVFFLIQKRKKIFERERDEKVCARNASQVRSNALYVVNKHMLGSSVNISKEPGTRKSILVQLK